MRTKLGFLLLCLLFPITLLAQDDWRDRRPRDRDDDERDRRERDRYYSYRRDNAVELTPFGGFTWGGTIYADDTRLFRIDADAQSSANLGLSLGIPVGDDGMKIEIMGTRQSTELQAGSGLFTGGSDLADVDISYLHAGIQFPFSASRTVTPFFVVSAGLANIDPDVRGASAENRFSASAGGGVKVPLSRNLGIRLEGRGYFTALEDDDDTCGFCEDRNFYQGQVNFGLIFSF
jgi:Outer membrane protein beta-barrel domain